MKWEDDIVPILRWMEDEGIKEIVPVLPSAELDPEKRLELADIMTSILKISPKKKKNKDSQFGSSKFEKNFLERAIREKK